MEEIRHAAFAEAAFRRGIEDDDFVSAVYSDYMDYRFRHLLHYPDARPFLTAVREAALPIALITNGNTTAEKASLSDLIDVSFVAHIVGLKKPCRSTSSSRVWLCSSRSALRVADVGTVPAAAFTATAAGGKVTGGQHEQS